MILKNYTSDVPAAQTIFKIQLILIKAGVNALEMEYGAHQEVTAITFRIQFDKAKPPLPIRMPAKVAEAQNQLWIDYVDGDKLSADGNSVLWTSRKKKTRKDFLEQGERTAWKLMQDWLEVQLSLIQLRQVDFIQVLLSYVWDGKMSFYDRLKGGGFAQLMPPKEEAATKWEVVS